MKANIEIKEIGSREATEMLANRLPEQRTVRPAYVDGLAYEMMSKKWRLSADAIVLVCGQLANGQHRLEAVVKSKTRQKFIVLETDDQGLYAVLDCGIKRGISDSAHCPKQVGATGNLALRILTGVATPLGGKGVDRLELLDFIEKNRELLVEASSYAKSIYDKNGKFIAPTLPAVLYTLAVLKGHQREKVQEFILAVYAGDKPGTSAHDIHAKAIAQRASKSKLHSNYMMAMMIKAYKSYLQGTRPGVLKVVEGSEFPTL